VISTFTAVEEKLIRLGLDPAAYECESDNCAVKLFRSLRKRGSTADQIISFSTQSTWADRELSAARGYLMPFGKHRGKAVGELPPPLHALGVSQVQQRAVQPATSNGNRP
jgi:hypothetical protein